MKKNLILGTATGYKYDNIRSFTTSLKKTGFQGEVALLVSSRIDIETKEKLLQDNVKMIYVDEKYLSFSRRYANSYLWKIHSPIHKLIFSILNKRKNSLKALINYIKYFHLISGSRYAFYYEYLSANKDAFDKVLITDVRDVIFQSNPFTALPDRDVLKFYCEDKSIKDSFYTSYWIKNAFGRKELEKVRDRISICSGTTMGSVMNLLTYLEEMIKMQARVTAGLTGLGGFDQGVHNYLIYNDYFPNGTVVANYKAEVATLGDELSVKTNDEDILVDPSNKTFPIVHQYDRFPELKLSFALSEIAG